ncbi:secreted phosphoprotein 24-like [Heptranchias perlo]|uniref:secreted phosphoprotein 24-like n=1 Tax=Heptranchias perlo TaxID=212740 RepID=UPI003559D433
MKSFLLIIAAVQILHCSGVPTPEDALRESVIKLNEITEITNDIYYKGKLSYNMDLAFTVKETVCSKNSGLEFDDPSCHFRTKKTTEKGLCKSRVQRFADEVIDIDMECRGLKTVDSNSELIKCAFTLRWVVIAFRVASRLPVGNDEMAAILRLWPHLHRTGELRGTKRGS